MICWQAVELPNGRHTNMHKRYLSGFLAVAGIARCVMLAQNAPPQQPMGFFVTSVGSGKGADLGEIAGADAQCQRLAAAAGAGSGTWHAYLSTSAKDGQPAVNARDRIGSGPWYNAKNARIAQNLGDLHGDTAEQARLG